MAISAISSNDNNYLASLLNTQQIVSQMQQNSPFAQLLQNNQNVNQTQGQQSNSLISNVAGQDFRNLASALQTGDLAGAQQAYMQLTQDMQSSGQTHGHHHHHHHASGTPQTNTANQVAGVAGSAGSASPTHERSSVTV